jgi:Carboxypeptidase regulatory-like domain
MRLLRGLVVLFIVAALGISAFGQTGTSTIRGTVTDQHGRVVPGAIVTLTNIATNAARTTKTSDGGAYVFDLITPSDYRVEVQAMGFKKKVVDSVKALIGKPTDNDVQLEVGTTTEIVEVQASAQEAVINTQDATLGNNFESLQITQLPLEARNLVDLLSLQPGSTREGYVTGARADQSNVTLDGVDINNAQTGNAEIPRSTNTLQLGALDNDRGNITSGPVLRLNAEAIEEFRVTTANGNANQGRSSGSQVNLMTKSGTNSWHGAAFEFYRGTLFEANDWFNNHATDANGNWDPVPRTALVRNTFGGALGGPVVKNRVFFFYSYEGRRDAQAQPVTTVVPLNRSPDPNDAKTLADGTVHYAYGNGQIGSLDLAQMQAVYKDAGINPAALAVFASAESKYAANDTSQGDQLNTGGFRFNSPTPLKLNSHVAKLDFNLSSKQTAFARLNVIYDHQTLPAWLPDAAAPSVWSHPWGLAAGHTWTIGTNWVNNFRYGFTRQAFSNVGDSNGNDLAFRFVFQPNGEQHTLTRVTPVHNFTDDISWVHGRHDIQFGTNIRLISNSRVSYANAFDFGETNPSFFLGGGEHQSADFQAYLNANNLPGCDPTVGTCTRPDGIMTSTSEVQNATTAAIGRLSEYTADFTFAKAGNLLSPGIPSSRDFATQAYDMYIQDTWKMQPNLTFTLGLRYSLERPVYETHGFEVTPGILQSSGSCTLTALSTYFQDRLSSAAQGVNFTDPVCVNRSGPANGGPPMYNWDKDNFQPRIAWAWSPNGGEGFLGRLLGHGGASVFRGGFSLTNDYYGQALAVDWDLNNTLGFTSNYTTPANTYDIRGSNQAPPFTGFGQSIRTLPNVVVPPSLQFPLAQPMDQGERIETSVDSNLHAPTEYVWNFTFERQLPKGAVFSASYIGRLGHGLLAHRDVMAFNDIRDPKSGMDWYTAGTMLEKQRQQDVNVNNIQSIPFFDNLFPAGMASIFNSFFSLPGSDGVQWDPTWSNTQAFYAMNSRHTMSATDPGNDFFSGNDWTDTQALVDKVLAGSGPVGGYPTLFMQEQYGALAAWDTIGNSNYQALTLSYRQRLRSLTFDFNYTWAHSLDDASGLQQEGGFGNAVSNGSFIVNPIRQSDSYASSDFDVRHNINADVVWDLPVGRGRTFMSGSGRALDALLGGWQLSSIFRWNTGLPVQPAPFDNARWATNWNVQAGVTSIKPVTTCPDQPIHGTPKLFGSCDVNQIYQNFRNAYPGETGPRNMFRMPGYVDLDLGLGKTWKMPHTENHAVQLRWDVFNVTNTQRFGGIDGSRTGFGVGLDPALNNAVAPANWSNFTQISGQPRVMQVGLRYSF